MKVEIKKSTPIGKVQIPPSKSIAHRLLICALLSGGESFINNISYCDDINATINCITALGGAITRKNNGVLINGVQKLNAHGLLKCNESGSTLRFLIPLALTCPTPVTFECSDRLIDRGIDIYKDILKDANFSFDKKLITVSGNIKPGNYTLVGNVSSQFISGLLFALPLLNGDSTITVLPPFESQSYVNLTIDTLKTFGVTVERKENTFYVKGNQTYKPTQTNTEGDWSNGAIFHSLNYLGGNVCIEGLSNDTLQGDSVCIQLFEMLNNGYAKIDISNCPDLAPILFAFASIKQGGEFVGTKRLAIKESNRAVAMQTQLKRFGVNATVTDNSVIIPKSTLLEPNQPLECYNDHRIAMALAILCTQTGGVIEGVSAVNKSYPLFFEHLKSINIQVNEIDG